MRITDLLDKRSISLDAVCASKSDALDQAVALMVKSGKINDEEAYRKQVYLREEESTTGIGEGIAIPHGKCDAVTKPGLAAMVIKDGVDFDSLDDEPVNLLFLIAAPNTEDNIHLDVLSKLSMLLMDENFVEKLKNASSVDEFLEIVDAADEEKPDLNDQLAAQTETEGSVCRIIAVTSCPVCVTPSSTTPLSAHIAISARFLSSTSAFPVIPAIRIICSSSFPRLCNGFAIEFHFFRAVSIATLSRFSIPSIIIPSSSSLVIY